MNKALKVCGYPDCSFKEVRDGMDNRMTKQEKEEKRKEQKEESDGQMKPYVRFVSEVVEQMLRSHGLTTAVRPHKMLGQLLVHPKGKRSVKDSAGVVYSIPCKDCLVVY